MYQFFILTHLIASIKISLKQIIINCLHYFQFFKINTLLQFFFLLIFFFIIRFLKFITLFSFRSKGNFFLGWFLKLIDSFFLLRIVLLLLLLMHRLNLLILFDLLILDFILAFLSVFILLPILLLIPKRC